MLRKLILICLILFTISSKANVFYSKIEIATSNPLAGNVTPLFFGAFIEFIKYYMNGPFGMAAQELVDRGFDREDEDGFGIANPWKPLFLDSSQGRWSLVQGGKNPNGKYSQQITKLNDKGRFGIYQHIFLTDSTANDFYIYFKGDSTVEALDLTLYDSTFNNSFYSVSLGKPDSNWKKVSLTIPYLPGIHYSFLTLTIKGKGSVEVDESSFIPKNNVCGIRKEHFQYFKELKPGILRYPGGCFADFITSHWLYGVGDIDKRKSPNNCWEGYSQRMDFGTDEYIAFCKLIGTEPHITVNYLDGTPAEAAGWVEYCNGSTETKYGAMRAANGHPEPYNVKYWEVGNEQWFDTVNMPKRYLEFYEAMKQKDSTLQIMIDGNIWPGEPFFNSIMSVAKDNVEIYGWHHANTSIRGDETIYHLLFLIGSMQYGEYWLNNNIRLLEEKHLYPKVKQGITEWWSSHLPVLKWADDIRAWTMETAIADALTAHIFIRNPESFVLAERTIFVDSGMLMNRFDSLKQKRQVFAGAPYYALMLIGNHSGNISYPVDIISPTYDIPEDKIKWSPKNVKWIDAVATSTRDSLFISVVNRHSSDTSESLILFRSIPDSITINVYQLSSADYLDRNSESEPYKVIPKYRRVNFKNPYKFPPNSLTILSFPLSEIHWESNYENDKSSDFLITPNPFDEKIFINPKTIIKGAMDYYLYDFVGRLIMEGSTTEFDDNYYINSVDLLPGVYILKIKYGRNTYSQLMVKIN